MTNRRRPSDEAEAGKALLKRLGLLPGVCMAHTDPPVMSYTQGVHIIRTPWVSRFTYRWGVGAFARASIRLSDFTYILASAFTTFVIGISSTRASEKGGAVLSKEPQATLF